MYKGMMNCSVNLFKEANSFGFYKGSIMIALRSVPVNAAITYGYEFILMLFTKYKNQWQKNLLKKFNIQSLLIMTDIKMIY